MPLTEKGQEIKANMQKEYGKEKGERVFYASKNKGTITGVDNEVVPNENITTPVSNTMPPAMPDVSDAFRQRDARLPKGLRLDAIKRGGTPGLRDAVGASSTVGGHTTGYEIETGDDGMGGGVIDQTLDPTATATATTMPSPSVTPPTQTQPTTPVVGTDRAPVGLSLRALAQGGGRR